MSLLPYKDIGTFNHQRKWGVMVRKGFITPQNKQHEKQYRFKDRWFFYFNILFSSQNKGSKN
jgi:hypothetical protein